MKKIFKSLVFAALTLSAGSAFAVTYSGTSTSYVPHPSIPGRFCEVTTYWTVEFDDNGNWVGSTATESNACDQIVVRQKLNATCVNVEVESLSVVYSELQGSSPDAGWYVAQYSSPEFLNGLANNMNTTIKASGN